MRDQDASARDKGVLGRILLGPSVFSRQQLNSERMSLPIWEGFVGSIKSGALKPSYHKENTSERESFQSLRSLPAQEAEGLAGLLNLPFLEDSIKQTGF